MAPTPELKHLRAILTIVAGWTIAVISEPIAALVGFPAPDILLILVLFLGLQRGIIAGQVAGVIVGSCVDLLTTGLIGPTAAGYLVVGHLGGWLGTRFERRKWLAFLVSLPVASLIVLTVGAVLAPLADLPARIAIPVHFSRALATLVVAPIALLVLQPLLPSYREM